MASILDSINSTLQGLGNEANEILGGSVSQPGLQLLGTNLPFRPLISLRDNFINSMNQWSNAIPIQNQFIAMFDSFPLGVSTNMLHNLEPIIQSTGFDIDLPKGILTNLKNQAIVGCIFLNGANLPAEQLSHTKAPINNNMGYIEGTVLGNRQSFSEKQLVLRFRETNTSFIDFVIRPWIIMASHFGYVARGNTLEDRLKNPKTNITLVQYGLSEPGKSMIPRKTWRFYNCVPIFMDNLDLNYGNDELKYYNVSWAFDQYEIENNMYLNIPDLLTSLNPFTF